MIKLNTTIIVLIAMLLLFPPPAVVAEDFGWMTDFNLKAEADLTDFRARVAARFKIGNADIDVVFGNVEKPADVYTILRYSELSKRPVEYVLRQYKEQKGNGWGALARSLGIKPGSREFKALKNGDDMYDYDKKDKSKGIKTNKGYRKDKNKGKM